MSIFTRRQYQWLAEFCATLNEECSLEHNCYGVDLFIQSEITEILCKALEKENSSFKPERFMKTYHKAED